ncbi:MAG: HAD hydrolase family protein [Rothia sp. (in: high G+C Gram-positive bacteria)]|uniref:HAD hydrolase family protein n=1 Tax=Rothia sp. (in: high G+C Gram-positive bacteria) TaxID=1885016 RepID=UPI0026DC4344|nr:HAD hydrolase family protein [Rothia sp. (in: high G+C Gram-positive bacteria)]MDO4883405.1 HAD hydrolase family protein [Rothia sp. (in: high G+C Gram-positive bacteria)]
MNFVFDIDGTTSFNGMVIEPAIEREIDALLQAGHRVVFASARPVRDILPMLSHDMRTHHGLVLIGANGSLLFRDGHLRVREHLDAHSYTVVRELIDRHGLYYIADSADSYAFDLPDAHVLVERLNPEGTDRLVPLNDLENPVKIILLEVNDPRLYTELEEIIAGLNLHVTKHQDATTSIDLAPGGVHKVSALPQALGAHPGENPGPYIAFGNDMNDLGVLEGAQYAVAVGSHEALTPHANLRVDAHPDAVAAAIRARAEALDPVS